MMIIIDEKEGDRLAVSLSKNVPLLLLMAVAGVWVTPAVWPVVYTVSVILGLLLVWLNACEQKAFSSSGPARFSSCLGTLAALGLLFALGSWAQNGLNHPLTHASNGAAVILLTLLLINEKYSPQPLVMRALRAQQSVMLRCWISVFYVAGAGTALFLLPIVIREQGLAGEMPTIIALIPLTLAAGVGYWLSGQWLRQMAAGKWLDLGLLSCAVGVGILYLSMGTQAGWLALLPAQLLLGLGHGMVIRRLPQPADGSLSSTLFAAANPLLVAIQYVSGAVAAGIIVIILNVYPGTEGVTHAFGLLTALAAGAVLVGDLTHPQGRFAGELR